MLRKPTLAASAHTFIAVFTVAASLGAPPADAALGLYEVAGGDTAFEYVADTYPLQIGDPDLSYHRAADGTLYVANGSSRVLRCLPPDDDAEWRLVPFTDAANEWALSGLFDGRIVVWQPDTSAGVVQVWDVACDDPIEDAAPRPVPLERPPGADPIAPYLLAPDKPEQFHLLTIDDRVCGADAVAVWCAGSDTDDEIPLWTTAERLGAAVADAPGTLAAPLRAGLDPAVDTALESTAELGPIRWTIRALRRGPRDLYALLAADAEFDAPDGRTVTGVWVVRVDGPDAVTVLRRADPQYRSSTSSIPAPPLFPDPLGQATELHYDAAWDALWVGPVLSWTPVSSQQDGVELGGGGWGYRVLPLSEPGEGFLDLSSAWAAVGRCQSPDGRRCLPGPVGGRTQLDGSLTLFRLYEAGVRDYEYALRIDRDAVDLDGDGLTFAEERGLGTSDFVPDFDADGADDGVELALGGDPKAPDTSHAPRTVALVASPLLPARLLRNTETSRVPLPDQVTVAGGPVCLPGGPGWQCRDADGSLLVEFDAPARPPIANADGTRVFVIDGDRLETLTLDGRDRRPVLDAAALGDAFGALLDAGGAALLEDLEFFPANGLDVWIANAPGTADGRLRVALARADGQVRVVLDSIDDACAAELGPCAPDPPPTGYVLGGPLVMNTEGRVLGYHAESDRLLVGLGGSWESYFVGLHAEAPLAVVARSRALAGIERSGRPSWPRLDWEGVLPSVALALPDGGLFTGMRPLGRRFEPGSLSAWSPWFAASTANTVRASNVRFRHFGPAIVGDDGLEYFYAPRAVSPGDTLYLAHTERPSSGEPGFMLYAIGPRGGANPLWERPLPGLRGPTGMHVGDDGRLCIADRRAQRLVELLPDEDGVPAVLGRTGEGEPFVDCLYDINGELLVLIENPARVMRAADDGELFVLDRPPGIDPHADLVATPDGFEVLKLLQGENAVRGVAWLPSGERFEFRNGDLLDPVTGDPVRLSGASLLRAVPRADGSIVVVFASTAAEPPEDGSPMLSRPPLLLLPDGTTLPVTALDEETGPYQAIAAVPGGTRRDPWSEADAVAWCWPPDHPNCTASTPTEDVGVDASPDAADVDLDVRFIDAGAADTELPDAVSDTAFEPGGRGGSGGCGCTNTESRPSAATPVLFLLLLAAVYRNRRETRVQVRTRGRYGEGTRCEVDAR